MNKDVQLEKSDPEKSGKIAKEKSAKEDAIFDSTLDTVIELVIMFMLLSVFLPMMPVVKSAQRYYDSQVYSGQSDSHTLSATGTLQHIVLGNPWIGVYFINDGPDAVMLRINDESSQPFSLGAGETLTLNRLGAEIRIYAIYYQCSSGETATIRIFGVY